MFDLKSRLLIVDDMLTMRKIVIKTCKEIGFTDFTEAADGKLAWELLNKSSPPIDLIISDWNMPNCTGLEFWKMLQKEPKYSKIPFVLLTAEAEAGQVLEAFQAGVTNYVVKPFTTQALNEKLEAAHKKLSK